MWHWRLNSRLWCHPLFIEILDRGRFTVHHLIRVVRATYKAHKSRRDDLRRRILTKLSNLGSERETIGFWKCKCTVERIKLICLWGTGPWLLLIRHFVWCERKCRNATAFIMLARHCEYRRRTLMNLYGMVSWTCIPSGDWLNPAGAAHWRAIRFARCMRNFTLRLPIFYSLSLHIPEKCYLVASLLL